MDKTKPSESTIKGKRALVFFIASILVGLSNLAFSSVTLTIVKAFLDLFFVYYLAISVWLVAKESAANFIKTKAKIKKEMVEAAVVTSHDDDEQYDENYSFGDDSQAQEFPVFEAEPVIVHSYDCDERNDENYTYGDDSPAREIPIHAINEKELEARALYESGYASFGLIFALKPHSSRFVFGE